MDDVETLKNKIAELKEENLNLKAKNIELQSFYDLHGNVDNYIDKLEAENAELKSEIRRKEAVEQRWFEQCMEARSEAIRLKRALWLTRTLRARDIQRWWIAATCAKITERACSVWNNVEHKCLKKAEEYK